MDETDELVDFEADETMVQVSSSSAATITGGVPTTSSTTASDGGSETRESHDNNSNSSHSGSSSKKIRIKGRGHSQIDDQSRYDRGSSSYDSIDHDEGKGPIKSIEGYIIFVTNIHPEAQEEDILDKFSEYGDVKNIHVNLDRRSGFVKGYALLELETYEDGVNVIKQMNGKEILGQTVHCDWAFTKK